MRTNPKYICDICKKPIFNWIDVWDAFKIKTIWHLEYTKKSYDVCGNCSKKITDFIDKLDF